MRGTSEWVRNIESWFATVLAKGTGEVLKIKHMRFGYRPTLDPERFLAVKVGESVEPGMVQNAEGFAWHK